MKRGYTYELALRHFVSFTGPAFAAATGLRLMFPLMPSTPDFGSSKSYLIDKGELVKQKTILAMPDKD